MGGALVFRAPCPSYHPLEYTGELLWVPRTPEAPLHYGVPCLLIQRPRAAYLLLYFHANAEDLGTVRTAARFFVEHLGVHVLAVEYPGYGICSGDPNEESVLFDAEVVFRFATDVLLVPINRILVMGRSVGGGPSIFLASKYECAGLVTVAAFSSLRRVVKSFVGWSTWFPDLFDNLTRIRSVLCPVLLIHGTEDQTVEVDQARELAEACGADVPRKLDVHLNLRVGVGHNDHDFVEDMVEPIKKVFPGLRQGRPLMLRAVPALLRKRTSQLAPDVVERVPYAVEPSSPDAAAEAPSKT